MDLTQLIAQHGAASWDKQVCLSDAIGDGDWQLSMSEGQITFGGRQSFPMQVLGSEADGDGTWLWAWANMESNLPPALLQAAAQIRAFGERERVAEFVAPALNLEDADGHKLSMIACGVCGADAYYRGPYAGGAVFLLLTAPTLRRFADDTPMRFIRIFTEFISAFPCDHRQALAAYAASKSFPIQAEADTEIVTLPAGAEVRAEFDVQGRLVRFSSTLTAENSAPRRKRSRGGSGAANAETWRLILEIYHADPRWDGGPADGGARWADADAGGEDAEL